MTYIIVKKEDFMMQEAEKNITEIQNTRKVKGIVVQATRPDQSKLMVIKKSSIEMSKPATIGIDISTNEIMVLPIDITVDGKKSPNAFFMVGSIIILSSLSYCVAQDYTKLLPSLSKGGGAKVFPTI